MDDSNNPMSLAALWQLDVRREQSWRTGREANGDGIGCGCGAEDEEMDFVEAIESEARRDLGQWTLRRFFESPTRSDILNDRGMVSADAAGLADVRDVRGDTQGCSSFRRKSSMNITQMRHTALGPSTTGTITLGPLAHNHTPSGPNAYKANHGWICSDEHKGHGYYYSNLCEPRLEQVDDAFDLAYQVVRSAEKEMDLWAQRTYAERKMLWRASAFDPYLKPEGEFRATLECWFGSADAPDFTERFDTVRNTLAWWSYRFRNGFWLTGVPVFIWCKPHYSPYDWIARHSSVNTISLYKPWFNPNWNSLTDLHAENQALTLLHEMGHLSQLWKYVPFLPLGGTPVIGIGLGVDMGTGPEDRSHSGCDGKQNKCYAEWPLSVTSKFFSTKNDPASLARKFEQGENGAYKDMLKNIDNYVCYMWNRWVNRELCMIDII